MPVPGVATPQLKAVLRRLMHLLQEGQQLDTGLEVRHALNSTAPACRASSACVLKAGQCKGRLCVFVGPDSARNRGVDYSIACSILFGLLSPYPFNLSYRLCLCNMQLANPTEIDLM